MIRRIYLLFYLVLPIFLFVLFFRPITSVNDDLMRHILLGNIISSQNLVPHTNLLSYTYPTFPFINTTWLYEVIVSQMYGHLGLNALLAVSLAIVFFSCLVEFRFVVGKFGNPAAVIVSTVYLFLLSLRTDVRPEIFSMFFMSLFVTILFRYLEKPTRYIYLLIPLELLWVNMHIYFISGPILILLFLLGNLKDKRVKNITVLVRTFLMVLLVTLLNPNTARGAVYPFTFFFNYGFPVVENQTPLTLFAIYKNMSILLPSAIVIFACFFAILKRKNHAIELLLVLFFAALTLLNFRNVLLFIFATFIPFAMYISFFLKQYKRQITLLPKITIPLVVFFSFFILFISIVKVVQLRGFGFGAQEYWKGSVNFLKKNSIKGPYFNDFNIGGYLSYQIYPAKVFIDNRPEAYPKSFFENVYIPMQKNSEIFKMVDKKYKFNALIISHYDATGYQVPILKYFVSNDIFSIVYLDSYSMVLLRNTLFNKKIIDTYKINIKNFPANTITDKDQLLRYRLFFEKVR